MAAILKATQSVSKAEDFREDTKNLMQPYANWEEYLVPAPVSIAILGELVCISSNIDFSINKNPPKDGFKFIKYPDSFRACLMQVANSGWAAFNEAHKNMDQIRLHTANVPAYIKTSVKILLQDNDELVQTLLPDQLENIATIAEECKNLAELTENKFSNTIYLIHEILEACVNAKKIYGDELEDVKRKMEEAEMRKKASEEATERAKRSYEEMNSQLNNAQKSFDDAMNSLPSGWDIVGLNFVEGLSSAFTGFLSGLATVVTFGQAHKKKSSATEDIDEQNVFAANNAFSKSGQLLKSVQTLLPFVHEDQIQWSGIYDQKSEKTKTAVLGERFQNIVQSLEKEKDCSPKSKAIEICKTATAICSELTAIAPEGKCDDAKTKELIGQIKDLMTSVQAFDSDSKSSTNTPAFTPQPPNLAKASGEKSAGQIATENARLRIEQSRAQLDKVREMQKESLENMEKNRKELTDILVTLRNCEVKEIDFNTTIKMLVKGLDAMGRVKEQWEKMVSFFQMISNIIKATLTTSLNDFVKTSKKASHKNLTYTSKMFMKDMIYNQASFACNISSLVNMISGTYVQISDKHLMDRVSSLGKLMALDPNNPQFQSERAKLQIACEDAQSEIRRLVKDNNRKFEEKTKERQEKIERELNAVLPPAPVEETEKIREITEAAFKDLSKDDESLEYGCH